MNKKLINEINRMHVLVYGKEMLNEQEKANMVSDNTTEFINTLKDASEKGGVSQQKKGSMNFQKSVESIQVALMLLGYSLPRYGADGLFGRETSNAIKSFAKKELNNTKSDGTATPQVLDKMIELLKPKQIKPDDLSKYIDDIPNKNTQISSTDNWVEITKDLLRSHEGFRRKPYWDENAWRAGYGTDKILVNGRLTPVTQDTIFTKRDAEDTLSYQIKNDYTPPIIKQLGSRNWQKLNDNQKASLVSLGYNVGPYFLTKRSYGIKIKNAIQNGDMEMAAEYIRQGPKTGSVSGQYYAGLERRRSEEADMFLS